jgi:hypothetical protein
MLLRQSAGGYSGSTHLIKSGQVGLLYTPARQGVDSSPESSATDSTANLTKWTRFFIVQTLTDSDCGNYAHDGKFTQDRPCPTAAKLLPVDATKEVIAGEGAL